GHGWASRPSRQEHINTSHTIKPSIKKRSPARQDSVTVFADHVRGSMFQRIIPEWPLALHFDIRAAHADVLESGIAECCQLLPLAVQLMPAAQLPGRSGRQRRQRGTAVAPHVDDLDITFLTFHLSALRVGWRQFLAGPKINPTNVSYAIHLED